MTDWYILQCKKGNDGNIKCVSHKVGDAINALNEGSGFKYSRASSTFEYTNKQPISHERESSPIEKNKKLKFTNVEGENIGGYLTFSRCSRTMMIITTVDQKNCVSCGRAASMSSLEWSWLNHKGCGVCGTNVL